MSDALKVILIIVVIAPAIAAITIVALIYMADHDWETWLAVGIGYIIGAGLSVLAAVALS